MTLTVDQAAGKIHQLVGDEGFLGTSRNDNMQSVRKLLGQFGPADEDKIVAKLSDADLKKLAGNVNHGGIFGAQGLDGGEKKDLFNGLARGLDGKQLGRVAAAFSDRSDVTALGDSVASFASSQAKIDFVKSLAPAATSGDTKFDTSWGTSSIQTGDKEAIAISHVLSSMKNDPAGFATAVKSLDADQLQAVVKAGEGQTVITTSSMTDGGLGAASATTTSTFDTAGLQSLLGAASACNDPIAKARVFEAGTKALDDIHGADTLLTPSPGAKDSAKAVAGGLTKLMNSDTRGIVNRLDTDDPFGHALTTYLKQQLGDDPKASNPAIGRQVAMLQGAGTGKTADQFYNTAEVGSNGDHFYRNAQNLGYYAGAMQAAIGKLKADAKTQGDILSNVFSTAISVGTAAMPGLSVAAKVGAQAFSGLTKEAVREIVGGVSADDGSLSNALMDLAVPHAPGQLDRTRGPADPFFLSASNAVSGANP
ncbi:hypothetical protein [Scleromatobacter humisilvae]|uniref:Uncharacterized protein n=1 Tax=Scleromatobacter humisilvae TaxID=2897159 RepID=A0A9X1YKC7_9BURK|nr:hypothetical protein [Scleromatobacter humisilvae]MCK9688119.1 hypothetical protein [Scleromatobacter humisilvae]